MPRSSNLIKIYSNSFLEDGVVGEGKGHIKVLFTGLFELFELIFHALLHIFFSKFLEVDQMKGVQISQLVSSLLVTADEHVGRKSEILLALNLRRKFTSF